MKGRSMIASGTARGLRGGGSLVAGWEADAEIYNTQTHQRKNAVKLRECAPHAQARNEASGVSGAGAEGGERAAGA